MTSRLFSAVSMIFVVVIAPFGMKAMGQTPPAMLERGALPTNAAAGAFGATSVTAQTNSSSLDLNDSGNSTISFLTAPVATTPGLGVTEALARPVGGARGLPFLAAPSVNVGSVCGYPRAELPCVGGSTAAGLITGNIAVGNNIAGIDAFINIYVDNIYTNPNQEMRGNTISLRESRSNADALIGWDVIPFAAAADIQASNTENIVGNLKGFVGETILEAPISGSYTARSAYPFQSLLYEVGANTTMTYWAGLLINGQYTGTGICAQCFGIDINPMQGTNTAAINLRGQGVGQGLSFPHNIIYEDTLDDLILHSSGAGNIEVDETFVPNADNTVSLGSASARWSQMNATQIKTGPYTIATLPTCSSATWGSQTFINNGVSSPALHQAVSNTGRAGWPVYCAFNGASYGWVY